jgi:hypothetical protein
VGQAQRASSQGCCIGHPFSWRRVPTQISVNPSRAHVAGRHHTPSGAAGPTAEQRSTPVHVGARQTPPRRPQTTGARRDARPGGRVFHAPHSVLSGPSLTTCSISAPTNHHQGNRFCPQEPKVSAWSPFGIRPCHVLTSACHGDARGREGQARWPADPGAHDPERQQHGHAVSH